MANGYYTSKDVDYIILIPHGSEGRTVIEQEYQSWLEKIRPQSGGDLMAPGGDTGTPVMAAARFPTAWLKLIEEGFKAWKEGRELPVDGTPLANWPVISPALVKNCLQLHVRTVEELAVISDEVVARLGMSGRNLQQRAKAWVEAKAEGGGKLGADLEKERALREAAENRIKSLEERLAGMEVKPSSVVRMVK